MSVRPDEIAALVELFAASNWDELRVESGGLQLFLSTDPGARLARGGVEIAPPRAAAAVHTAQPAAMLSSARTVQTSAPASPAPDARWKAIKAPNLGTFYRSPKPGSPPLIEIGQRVEPGTEVCLIEVMKLFTAVRAGIAGIVRQVCVADAELVQGEQILFYVEPA